jgi:hypothetical protein
MDNSSEPENINASLGKHLKGLDAGHFIQTFDPLPLLRSFRRSFVNFVDLRDLAVKTFFIGGCQPVPAQVGLDISVFLKAWPHGRAKFLQRSGASSIHPQFLGLTTV